MNSANPDRWRRIEAVLGAALQLRPEERAAFLQRECGDDRALLEEVASLLAADADSAGFLATSAPSFAAPFLAAAAAREPSDRRGTIIGRYRLIDEIGRGGMGVVWLAERADGQFEQRVALKLVKRGMDSDEILARFLRERQILARLEHANIARLLDGGVSEDGRPYFVMEYVTGKPVTVYSDEKKCSIDERLRLFVVIARAVGYAHRNLIVHRDIKPSNVLVGDNGDIRLLDFGIAKLLDDDPDVTDARTGTVGRLMTPEYASPEQVNGDRASTASDVYQLGVLLYELLTGRRPYANAAGSASSVRRPSRTVRQPASLPSSGGVVDQIEPVVVSAHRATTPERLRRRLKGDLDTIVLRALREEPDRRYPSAEAMAEDVERHLAFRPILSGGDRGWYRASKFVRRHRLGVAGMSAMIAVGLSMAAFAVQRVRSERDRARYEADKSAEVAQLMARFLQGWSPDASDRGEISTRKLLSDAAVRAERELKGRPDMLGATLSLLGDFHATIGEWAAADTLLARAQAIQRRLYTRPTGDLAATQTRRARLLRLTGRYVEARSELDRALTISRALFGTRHPETLRIQREVAKVLLETQQYRAAEPVLRAILTSTDTTGGNYSPLALETASELGYVVYQLGGFDEAVAILRRTLEQQRALFGDLHVSTLTTMRMLGSAERDRGNLDDAETMYRGALHIAQTLYGDDHAETELATFVLALCLERKRDLEGAEALMRKDLGMVERLYGHDHPMILSRRTGIASIRLDRGDLAGAERELRLVVARVQRSESQVEDQGDFLNRLAYILVHRGASDADRAYRAAVAYDNARSAGQHDFVTDGLHFLAWAEHRKGDLAAAEQDYRRALAVYERQLPADHPYRAAADSGLRAVQRDAHALRAR